MGECKVLGMGDDPSGDVTVACSLAFEKMEIHSRTMLPVYRVVFTFLGEVSEDIMSTNRRNRRSLFTFRGHSGNKARKDWKVFISIIYA